MVLTRIGSFDFKKSPDTFDRGVDEVILTIMVPLNDLGKILVFVGLGMVLLGGLLWSGRGWLSRLPGDIYYAKGHFTFSMPIVTCLLLSLILSLIAWIFRR